MKVAIGILLVTTLVACAAPGGEHEAIDSAEEAMVVCTSGEVVEGIDVSGYEPNTNWQEVKQDGRGFAFVKATEGYTYVNPYFDQDWHGIKAAGLIRGAYHFFHPGKDPLMQADHFVTTVAASGGFGATDLPPVCDLEVDDGASPDAIATSTATFLERVAQQTGMTPIIYTASYFWNGVMGAPSGFEKYPLWVASWVPDCPDIPTGWSAWPFWQYSDSGSVAGVQSTVDVDRFNGTMEQLAAFGLSQTPTVTPSAVSGTSNPTTPNGGSNGSIQPTPARTAALDGSGAVSGAACAWSPSDTDPSQAPALLLAAIAVTFARRRRAV